MSTTPDPDESVRPRSRMNVVLSWLGLLVLLSLVVGALVALFWTNVVHVPAWHVGGDGSASMTQAGWTQMMAIDAWYVVCAVLVGPGIGIVAWRWFKPLGWPAALIAALAGFLTGFVCAQLGPVFGPGSFAGRIAAANPGDDVPVAIELQSLSALAMWPLAAVTPVLLVASLGHDPEVPRKRRRGSAGDVGEDAAGDAQQVGGGQFDVEAASAAGHQDRVE